MIKLDKIELKWGMFEVITNQKGECFYNLIRYKRENEKLNDFLEQRESKNHIALRYFINGKDFADYLNSMNSRSILEVTGHYFNTLSFNLHPKSYSYDKNLTYERITLNKLLCHPEPIFPTSNSNILNQNLESVDKIKVEKHDCYIYICGCKNEVCGGWAINVKKDENVFIWDINIRNHRKYMFEENQYLTAFQEIITFVENHIAKPLE